MTKDEMENKSKAFITEISEILGLGKPIDILKLCATTDLFFKPLEDRIIELEKENAEMNKQLTKAKEIIKYLCGMARELNKPNVQLTDVDCSLSEAEQFVSKVEQ